MTYGLDDDLKFGKHCGKTVREVMKKEPAYIHWLLSNLSNFDLDEEAMHVLSMIDGPSDD
jgi:hypothetical protein